MKKLLFLFPLAALPAISLAELEISVQGGISGLTSNSVIDIYHDSSSVWLGTGGGAAVTTDNGASWTTYGVDPLPTDEISALVANNRAIWVANSHSVESQGQSYPFGDGVSFTRDGGLTWTVTRPEAANYYGKLSYDLDICDSLAYAACFYGGLIWTTDWGTTWTHLFPTQLDSINADSIDYFSENPQYLSLRNRFFAVKADTFSFPNALSIWGGNAYGLTRFFFNSDSVSGVFHAYPDSIANYFYTASDTAIADSLKLPGNHVVALGITRVDTTKYIWAACRPVFSGESYRVAYTNDDGYTWHSANIISSDGDDNVEGWDFAFSADTVYAATSFGLFRSQGDYRSWSQQSGFVDTAGQTIYWENAPFYSVDLVDGTVWAGGADGVVKSVPGGWKVYRSQLDPNDHYAYPSPFSPEQSVRQGTTIHFKPTADTRATVKIYDFNLDLVKTVRSGIFRRGGVESDDIVWDGTNDDGKIVANGVYFYRIELDSGDDLWGKVVVIR